MKPTIMHYMVTMDHIATEQCIQYYFKFKMDFLFFGTLVVQLL